MLRSRGSLTDGLDFQLGRTANPSLATADSGGRFGQVTAHRRARPIICHSVRRRVISVAEVSFAGPSPGEFCGGPES